MTLKAFAIVGALHRKNLCQAVWSESKNLEGVCIMEKCIICHDKESVEVEIKGFCADLCAYCSGLYNAGRYALGDTVQDVLNDLQMEVAYTRLADLCAANDRKAGDKA